MLLRQLIVENIRSYHSQTILFPEGSTILAGDIGCGKSSLLLAIEFALFGTSRPDLPAEALLRKDSMQGSVELTFVLGENEITIKRVLKKEKEGIKQMPGYLIINNLKKELMPVELKTEIISLLGYPEDAITKNKNYLFRYTVYTPQEEMKSILHENNELRLDILRKIFNVEKYKIIRENLLTYLRELRSTMIIQENTIAPLDEKKRELHKKQQEQESIEQQLKELLPQLERLQQQLQQKRQEIIKHEQQQRQYLQLQQKAVTLSHLIEQKKNYLTQLLQQQEQVQLQIAQRVAPGDLTSDMLRVEILALEQEYKKQTMTSIESKSIIEQIQNTIKTYQELNQETATEISSLEEKKTVLMQLQEEAKKIPECQEKAKQIDNLLEKTLELISKNRVILEQAQEMERKIALLSTCPTCLQEVSADYKERIITVEQQKIKQAENLLFELNKKRIIIFKQREDIITTLQQLLVKQDNLRKITQEINTTQEKKNILQKRIEKVQELAKEKDHYMCRWQDATASIKNNLYEQKLTRKRELLEQLVKRQQYQQQLSHIVEQISTLQQEITNSFNEHQQVEEKLLENPDQTAIVNEKNDELQQFLEREKELTIQKTKFQFQKETNAKQISEMENLIDTLIIEKNKHLQWQELHHWLEEYFIKLTSLLEKHIMIAIYQLFNQLFQEWFSIILNDETLYARLDDSFTPIIEQNGYEIPFLSLSGGEKTSAALAYRLALNRVINDVVHDIKTKDLLILDEPTDGFSSEQLDKVRDVLERLNLRQTILVSHEAKIETFVQNVLRVRKEEGRSVVV